MRALICKRQIMRTRAAPLKPHVLLRSTRTPQTPNRPKCWSLTADTRQNLTAACPPTPRGRCAPQPPPPPTPTQHNTPPAAPPALTCRPRWPNPDSVATRGDSIVREGGNLRGDVAPQQKEHLSVTPNVSVNSGLWTAGRGVGAERLDGAEAEKAALCHAPSTWWAGLPLLSASTA